MNYTKEQLIQELGIQALSEEAQARVLESVYTTLNTAMARRVAEELTDEQLDELAKIPETDKAAVNEWLENTVDNYDTILSEEMQEVLTEIKESSAGFLGNKT